MEIAPAIEALNRLLAQLRESNERQQRFLANAAHQLRTPLAGLKTQLEWLQRGQADREETARALALMMSSAERMIRQTNQLLALARAEPGQFEKTRLYPLALDKLVEESIQHFVEEADKKKIDLGFDLSPVTIGGDRFLLRDLIDNLVDNAIRYTPAGGRVDIAVRRLGGLATLQVDDTGPGIPLEERERVFDSFYRVLGNGETGSGLGLAISRTVAASMDASIELSDARPPATGLRALVTFRRLRSTTH